MQETKKYACPGCGVALEFDPESQKLYCGYCGHAYTVEELEEQQLAMEELLKKQVSHTSSDGEDNDDAERMIRRRTIPMQVLHCNSCGAELMVTRTEASTFCAFCGQATVIVDRVAGCLEPDVLIPFKVTREEAEQKIRRELESRWFVPREIKEFEPERLSGIYLPCWMYDIYYGEAQQRSYHTIADDEVRVRLRVGDVALRNLVLDASSQVPDEYSKRLEPYDFREQVEFDPAYLSGFYSDRFDVDYRTLEKTALERVGKMFERDMKKSAGGAKVSSEEVHMITRAKYALLPVWFLTFYNKGTPFTLMVNGQTGKTVGTVPYSKPKYAAVLGFLIVAFGVLMAWIFAAVIPWKAFQTAKDEAYGFGLALTMVLLAVPAVSLILSGAEKRKRRLNESCNLTKSVSTAKYAGERQEK